MPGPPPPPPPLPPPPPPPLMEAPGPWGGAAAGSPSHAMAATAAAALYRGVPHTPPPPPQPMPLAPGSGHAPPQPPPPGFVAHCEVTVQLEDGRPVVLAVQPGDIPEVVVEEFCAQYDLTDADVQAALLQEVRASLIQAQQLELVAMQNRIAEQDALLYELRAQLARTQAMSEAYRNQLVHAQATTRKADRQRDRASMAAEDWRSQYLRQQSARLPVLPPAAAQVPFVSIPGHPGAFAPPVLPPPSTSPQFSPSQSRSPSALPSPTQSSLPLPPSTPPTPHTPPPPPPPLPSVPPAIPPAPLPRLSPPESAGSVATLPAFTAAGEVTFESNAASSTSVAVVKSVVSGSPAQTMSSPPASAGVVVTPSPDPPLSPLILRMSVRGMGSSGKLKSGKTSTRRVITDLAALPAPSTSAEQRSLAADDTNI